MKKISKGWVIDHINRNKLDNRLKNLRLATIKENSRNTSKQKGIKNKYKGVYKISFSANRIIVNKPVNTFFNSFFNPNEIKRTY